MTFSVKEIMEYLPHRYPFLLIDRVEEIVEGEKIVCIKNVTINEPFFQGHFPGEPIMPGVLIVEAIAQACGMLAFYTLPEIRSRNADVRFLGIDKCRFRRPVVPGDQIRIEVGGIARKKSIWKCKGKAFVDDNLVAEAELMLSV
jgi:3-hydroxyacyl-[acyl-carrier-protein] dehydratase